jgi:hypothetical protein
MNKRRVFAILFVSILCLLFLTSCVDEQMLDQGWLDRANATVNVEAISPYFRWILWLAVPLMIFSFLALLKDDYVSAIHWLAIMVVGVGSFLRIVDVIQDIGKLLWPDGYTISAVMDWMGWQIPFPKDAVWTSPYAYAFTDLIPSLYSVWQWALIAVHGLMLMVVSFSRNLKPIVVDFAFIFSWAIAPSILALMTRAFAAAKAASSSVVTKAVMEGLYVVSGFGVFAVFFVFVPIVVGLAALFIPWGRLNPSWKRDEKKEKDEVSLINRIFSGVDRDAAAAFFGSLVGQVPPPDEGMGGSTGNVSSYGSQFPMLPPGGSSESPPDRGGSGGPSGRGPRPSSPPSGRPKDPSPGDGGGNREPGYPFSDVVDTKETSRGVFEPLPDSGVTGDANLTESPKPETEDISSGDENESIREKYFPFLEGQGSVSQGLEDLGKTAKAAAPFVAPLSPEAGLALGLTGSLLDRSEDRSHESSKKEFPHLEDRESRQEVISPSDVVSGEAEEETFAPIPEETSREKARSTREEDEEHLFPPLDRR